MNIQREGEKMNKLMSFMEDKVAPVFAKVATNPYLAGIKDGMVSTVPFTIFGSLFQMIVGSSL